MQPENFPIVDHRVYTIALRKMPEFLDIFDRLGLPVLVETLGNPLGMYVSYVGPLNQFVHQWGYVSLADYEERCRKRDSHEGFKPYLAATEKLIVAQENRLIKRVELKSMPKR
jgi:hypothetical protein